MPEDKQALIEKASEYLKTGEPELAIEILTSFLGPDHHYVAIGYNALGAKQYDQGNWQGARLSIEQAYIIWRESKGEKSLEVASCANNLGRIYESLGDMKKGIEMHREALSLRAELLGENHVDTGMSLLGLGTALASNGQLAEAGQIFTRGITLFSNLGMNDSPEINACRANLILCQENGQIQ
ncbi:MAG: tetratricopeptide repeat protein [Desulfotalea sp.]